MKKILSILLLSHLALAGCKEAKTPDQKEEEKEVAVETLNETLEQEDPILLGEQHRDVLEANPYNKWFMTSYKDHTLDTETLTTVKAGLKDVRITAFMGTWCEDSQREVPAFYKILDEVDYASSTVKLITVSEEKTTPEGLEKGKEITNVPTFIFMKDGKELGRIVEYPLESLEKDMAKILTGQPYKHAYEAE